MPNQEEQEQLPVESDLWSFRGTLAVVSAVVLLTLSAALFKPLEAQQFTFATGSFSGAFGFLTGVWVASQRSKKD